jgi:hypothetical protein
MEFWIEIHSCYKIMAAINYTLASLQGKQLILDVQKQELESGNISFVRTKVDSM